jgi:hypothetical protein
MIRAILEAGPLYPLGNMRSCLGSLSFSIFLFTQFKIKKKHPLNLKPGPNGPPAPPSTEQILFRVVLTLECSSPYHTSPQMVASRNPVQPYSNFEHICPYALLTKNLLSSKIVCGGISFLPCLLQPQN